MEQAKKRDGFQNEYLFVLPEQFLAQYEPLPLFAPLLVTDIGYFPHASGHYRQRDAGCPAAILLYCHAGRGFVSQHGGDKEELHAGQAILIDANTPHRYGASEEEPWSIFWFHLRGSLLPHYLQMARLTEIVTVEQGIAATLVEQFYRCFELLKAPYQTQEYFLLCQTAGYMLGLLACAEKQSQLQLTCKGGQAIAVCVHYMKENLAKTLTREQLARACGFSASHLNALFQQTTGHAPIAYFLRMKLHAASKELYFSRRTVKEVAASYGWDDPYYFSRLFKHVMGVSPTEYRNQAKG